MRLRLAGIRRALIVAPHPDDEIIGAAGLIRRLKTIGAAVSVVIVSDGGASHPGSRRWPRARLVAERRRESRRALLMLGVSARDLRCLALPDGDLPRHVAEAVRHLRRLSARADLIVGPAADDAHPDHRAVAAALDRLPGRARRLSYRVWPPRRRGDVQGLTLPVPGGSAFKRLLIARHRTQLGAIRDDPAGFAIAAHELRAFAQPIERFGGAR
ncbi:MULTISPECIES: PIG-L deacetylase family protein [Sphingomonas]|uniref:PIG-L family deacetylase n=1 Tax=Sphingomonas kyungheensis TaxID=1069987 RepID=A0ABU8H680_9SPHN|nr:PIG-L family deacetylase [Sphingomonas sp. RIT328]EZP54972.1 GlcNAc-PI de-N-acetylase family protein [Sphingomonas sp. RIT328]